MHHCDDTCQPPQLPSQLDFSYWVQIERLPYQESLKRLQQAAYNYHLWMLNHPDKRQVAEQYVDDQALELEVALDLRKHGLG